jgi:hypothetical protein
VEQVTSLLNKVKKTKEQVFLPLEMYSNPNGAGFILKEARNQDEVGDLVFNKEGFVSMAADKNGVTDVISRDEVIQQGVENLVLNQIPWFRKFCILRVFKLWKQSMERNVFLKNREKLAKNYIFSKPIFSSIQQKLTENLNEIRFLKFIDAKPNC